MQNHRWLTEVAVRTRTGLAMLKDRSVGQTAGKPVRATADADDKTINVPTGSRANADVGCKGLS